MSNIFIEIIAVWLIAGGFIGIPYLTVIIIMFCIIKVLSGYKVNYFELTAIIAPIVFYIVLSLLIEERQGFNSGYVNLIMVFFASITLYLGTISHLAFRIGIIVTLILTILLWQFFPNQGFTKLF